MQLNSTCSVCLVYDDQTVQDKPIYLLYIEVAEECGVDISISTIFDSIGPPYPPPNGDRIGVQCNLTLEFRPNGGVRLAQLPTP